MNMFARALFLAGLTVSTAMSGAAARAAEAPAVAVSIKPLHSLVAAIMFGVGEPKLIVGGAASPHEFSLKPSNAEDLQKAKIVFWLGPEFEQFMTAPLKSLAAEARVVTLEKTPGLALLPIREGGTFDKDDDGDAAAGNDLHFWLDPQNAALMVDLIRAELVRADPAHEAQYNANAKAFDANLVALDNELQEELEPLKAKPFIVFHDAYQYFEKRYGLNIVGSITVFPETAPGAARLAEIHQKIETLGGACVFAEPQFEPKLINVVVEGTNARSGVLDPEGSTLPEGPGLYFKLLRGIGASLKECLSKE